MTNLQNKALTTRAVHAGERAPRPDYTPVTTPIHPTVGYLYDSMNDLDAVFGDREPSCLIHRAEANDGDCCHPRLPSPRKTSGFIIAQAPARVE